MKELDQKEIDKLWQMLVEKDRFTAEHTRRVSRLVGEFARKIGWEPEKIEQLQLAGLLHDLGKVDLPDDVFEKIRTGKSLTAEDRQKVRQHTGHVGILKSYQNLPPTVENVLKYHHEKYDGSGYPFKLKGEEIPVEVRMLTIADYYDTIVVQRPHKTPDLQEPLGKEEAIKILIDQTHTRLDPDLTAKFIKLVVR